MGQHWLHALPKYFDKWGVRYRLHPGWETRSRSSGGFDEIRGIGVHHTADNYASVESILRWETETSGDRPIGNATLHRDGVTTITAAGATNTQGRGVALWTSRGTIPTDSANRFLWSLEAQNKGDGSEVWTAAMVEAYPLVCAAVLDCINNETSGSKLGVGDIFAHFETAPTRKIDPAGPSPWAQGAAMWDMDRFRGDVFALLAAGPPGSKPTPTPNTGRLSMFPELVKFYNDGDTYIWMHGNKYKTRLGPSAVQMEQHAIADQAKRMGASDADALKLAAVQTRSPGMAPFTGIVANPPGATWRIKHNKYGARR